MTIGEVRAEHFGKKFKLEVANELGSIEQKINLQEGQWELSIDFVFDVLRQLLPRCLRVVLFMDFLIEIFSL